MLLFVLFILIVPSCSKKLVFKVSIKSITASSTLEAKMTSKYSSKNIFKPYTMNSIPWSEGKSDDGVNEYIEVTFSQPILFNKLMIVNGFNNSRWYKQNNRIKKLMVSDGSRKDMLHLKDTMYIQEYNLKKSLHGKKIKFTIKSVYKGSVYKDTCLSHMVFYYNNKKIEFISSDSSVKKSSPKSLIKETISLRVPCPPGGMPIITFKKHEFLVEWKKMKVYGMPEKGIETKYGRYVVDMKSLRKRDVTMMAGPEMNKKVSLLSAKIKIYYNDGTSNSGYIVDSGKNELWYYNICGMGSGLVHVKE